MSIANDASSKSEMLESLAKETSLNTILPKTSWKLPDFVFSEERLAVSATEDIKEDNFFTSPGNSTKAWAGLKILPISIFTPIKTPADSVPAKTKFTPMNRTTTVRTLLIKVPTSDKNVFPDKFLSFAFRNLPSMDFHSAKTSFSNPSLFMSMNPSLTDLRSSCL